PTMTRLLACASKNFACRGQIIATADSRWCSRRRKKADFPPKQISASLGRRLQPSGAILESAVRSSQGCIKLGSGAGFQPAARDWAFSVESLAQVRAPLSETVVNSNWASASEPTKF